MTEPIDPPRLKDEKGALARALGAAEADLPGDASLDAIFAKLPTGGGGGPSDGGGSGGPGAGGSVAPAAGTASGIAGTKLAVLATLVGSMAAVFYGVIAGPRPPIDDGIAPAASEPTATAHAVPSATTAAPAVTASDAAPNAPASASTTSVPAHAVTPSPSASSPTRSEIEILRDAQAALGGSPAKALALAAEHERGYPNGSLGQEREMIRIQALLALGRKDEARARAARFEAAHPGSAYATRLHDLVGD
jgi:hypothetical protein